MPSQGFQILNYLKYEIANLEQRVSLESNGAVSLSALFDGKQDVEAMSDLSIEKIAFALCRGGWPASIKLQGATALRMAMDYVEAVINYDVSRVDNVEKNPDRVRLLLRSLARNIATSATYQTIKSDIEATDITISDKTISSYMNSYLIFLNPRSSQVPADHGFQLLRHNRRNQSDANSGVFAY